MARAKKYDATLSARMADFVRGRTDVPRAMFLAAFPHANASCLSLLTAMGHLERAPRGNPNATAVLLAHHERTRPEREAKKAAKRAERVAKLEAKLAALRGPTEV